MLQLPGDKTVIFADDGTGPGGLGYDAPLDPIIKPLPPIYDVGPVPPVGVGDPDPVDEVISVDPGPVVYDPPVPAPPPVIVPMPPVYLDPAPPIEAQPEPPLILPAYLPAPTPMPVQLAPAFSPLAPMSMTQPIDNGGIPIIAGTDVVPYQNPGPAIGPGGQEIYASSGSSVPTQAMPGQWGTLTPEWCWQHNADGSITIVAANQGGYSGVAAQVAASLIGPGDYLQFIWPDNEGASLRVYDDAGNSHSIYENGNIGDNVNGGWGYGDAGPGGSVGRVTRDSNGQLHYSVNGSDGVVFADGISGPLHAQFEVGNTFPWTIGLTIQPPRVGIAFEQVTTPPIYEGTPVDPVPTVYPLPPVYADPVNTMLPIPSEVPPIDEIYTSPPLPVFDPLPPVPIVAPPVSVIEPLPPVPVTTGTGGDPLPVPPVVTPTGDTGSTPTGDGTIFGLSPLTLAAIAGGALLLFSGSGTSSRGSRNGGFLG